MTALIADASPADATGEVDLSGPFHSRADGRATADRSPAAVGPGRTMRSWPLLVLAAPAAVEVWSGWVGIAAKTGFGRVSLLPGLWPSLHLDTAITLPVGVEAYAAYALRAWLASGHAVSPRTRRFAKWSAICSFALGMVGQVAYHLLAQAGTTRAPWAITTIVSCLPVLVLGMGTTLAHMLHADAAAADTPSSGAAGPVTLRSAARSEDQAGPGQDQAARHQALPRSGPPAGTTLSRRQDNSTTARTTRPASAAAQQQQMNQAHLIARKLAAEGKPVSRRALRNAGARGSNQALNTLAHTVNAEQPADSHQG
jgi:hypothetical protein